MKKLLSVFAAVAMLFGFVSCSGDLHDDVKIDPNAMKGYWSYRILSAADVAPSGEVAVIANRDGSQTGAYGSPDFKVPATAGKVNYLVWDGKGGTDFTVSGRTDAPTIDLSDGEFAICVFTPYITVNLYCYGGDGTDDSWPGVEATATVEVEMVNVVINGATVTANGLPEALNGTTLYFTGGFNNWTAPGQEGTIEGTVTNGSITITLPELSAEVAQGAAQEIIVEGKFANTGWSVPEIAGLINEKQDGINNVKVTITPSKKTIVGTYSANNLADKYECTWEVK